MTTLIRAVSCSFGGCNLFRFSVLAVIFLSALAGCASGVSSGERAAQSRVIEMDLTAAIREVTLTEDGLTANAFTFNGGSPGPQIRMRVGDSAVITFKNRLPFATVVHWHGIELDNANDGTTVTQNLVPPGENYVYRFMATRPGIFWYHPHSMPTNSEFKGLYGSIIVTDEADAKLVDLGVLPAEQQTHTLMLGDTTVCKEPGKNDAVTFPAGGDTAWAFSETLGPFPGLVDYPSPADLCEKPRDREGATGNLPAHQAGDIPNIMPARDCSAGGNTFGFRSEASCRVNEGQLVLTNGMVAAGRDGTPEKPGELRGEARVYDVRPGEGVRLRLINAAVSRYFRLRLTDSNGQQVTLIRIGGEGGLLDSARVEGGMLGTLDTKYAPGEIVLGVANRNDVVFSVPDSARPGDVLTLWTLDFQHYGTAQYPHGYAGVPTVPVAHFRVGDDGSVARFEMTNGTLLRMHPEVASPNASLREHEIDTLLDPTILTGDYPGNDNPEFLLAVVGLRETIDGIHGTPLEGGGAEFTEIPHLLTSRYARLGDTLELTFRNGTQMHHPMHLHGFSYQPLRLEDLDGNLIYEFDHNEFVDTFDVPSVHKLVMRVHLEDRPQFATGEPGGGKGRWLLHCHIFNHAGLGMITELVVVDEAQIAAPASE